MTVQKTGMQLRPVDICVLVLFALICAVLLSHHEIAHDEAQAWNIARSASLPWNVIDLGRYEGHTPFWHMTLWPLALTGNPFWMQVASACLGFLFALILWRDKPFPALVCLLILFGYYPLYEYSIVPRPYALVLILMAALASLLYRNQGSFLVRALLCALLGFTSAFGAVISLPLMGLLIYEEHQRGAWQDRVDRRWLLAGMCLYGVLVAVAAYLVVFPIAATAFEAELISGANLQSENALLTITTASFPHFDRLPAGIGPWLSSGIVGPLMLSMAGVIVVLAVAIHLYPYRPALLCWLLAVVLFSLAVLYSGSRADRHLGHLFLLALVLCWSRSSLLNAHSVRKESTDAGTAEIASSVNTMPVHVRSETRTSQVRTGAAAVLIMVLAYHFVIGMAVAAFDVTRPLTTWQGIRDFLIEHNLQDRPLLMESAYDAGALTAYLDHTPYDMRCRCWQRYGVWYKAHHTPTPDQMREKYCELREDGYDPIALVSNVDWQPGPPFELLASFEPGVRQRAQNTTRLYQLDPELADDRACLK